MWAGMAVTRGASTRSSLAKIASVTLVSVAGVRENARTRILEAAVRLIARDGLDEARLARIATAAGVSPSLLHYHFASRDALLAEALEHSYETAGDFRISEPGGPQPARRRLERMIDQSLPHPGQLRDHWVLWVELWLHAARRPELRATSARLYARLHEWFAEAIEAGVSAGEFASNDIRRTTDRLIALLDGYGVRALAGDPEMPIERAKQEIWAALEPELRSRASTAHRSASR
jgi:AcrR family transcriptional regulator